MEQKIINDVLTLKEKNEDGMLVWRIKNMKLEKVNNDIGTFYKGDCYVIMNKSKGKWYIFYWLGADSSQDERGTAAVMTVSLDEILGGKAIQVREVNGFDKNKRPLESDRFLNLFNGKESNYNYIVKNGGYESGFKDVNKINYPVRLYKIKGVQHPVMSEVEAKTSSLHSDDCYILDAGRKCKRNYILHGKNSNNGEKTKALKMVKQCYPAELKIYAENEIDMEPNEEEKKILKKALGVSVTRPIKFEGCDTHTDEEEEHAFNCSVELFQVTDGIITEVPFKQSSLDSGDCFVLRTDRKVYVWKGKHSNIEEKRGAIRKAETIINQKRMHKDTEIMIVPEDLETPDFKACFADWKGKDEARKPIDYSRPAQQSNVARSVHTAIDFRTLYHVQKPEDNRDENLEDDLDQGNGKTTIYRVVPNTVNEEEKVLETNEGFVFDSYDSYVVVYRYKSKRARGNEKGIIYYWIGNDSVQIERGTAALVAMNVDEEQFRGTALQVRVTEGKESPHFMKIFGGYIMIKQDRFDGNQYHLFHIKGKEGNIKVVEVNVDAANLTSNDCFVLKTPKRGVYLWFGKGSLGDEQRIAHDAAQSMFGTSCSMTKVMEGTETDGFWEAIGGRKLYDNRVVSTDDKGEGHRDPRLFRFFNIKGSLEAEEVYDFVQDDLDGNDVFLLDLFTHVYVWIGKDCRPDEKKMITKNLEGFINDGPTGRTALDVKICTVHQGSESQGFISHFGGWEDNLLSKRLTFKEEEYETIKQCNNTAASKNLMGNLNYEPCYSYEALTTSQPAGVEAEMKELHLSETEFHSVFGMAKNVFVKLPKWQQKQMKTERDLF